MFCPIVLQIWEKRQYHYFCDFHYSATCVSVSKVLITNIYELWIGFHWMVLDGWSSVTISVDAVVTGVKQGGAWGGWSSIMIPVDGLDTGTKWGGIEAGWSSVNTVMIPVDAVVT